MLPSLFSRSKTPEGHVACQSSCRNGKSRDDNLSAAAQKRIESLTGRPEPATGKLTTDDSPSMTSQDASRCQFLAQTLGPTLRRFNRYREALPYARAANNMNELGDKPGTTRVSERCLSRLPDTGDALCDVLGLKRGTITDTDLRNDKTGFRAAVYRDESTGKLILVARDTQPKSLVDWQTNTRNGDGFDTDQYAAMRRLSRKLSSNDVPFDLAGYSKGGGLAQEAALVNRGAKAFVFNSAGLHPNSLQRTGNADFSSLESRTSSFSAEGEFLTYMNETTDPNQQLENVRFLRRELVGENRSLIAPMKIDHRNPEQARAKDDSAFESDRDAYMAELDRKIATMERDLAKGKMTNPFPPVRAVLKETIPDSMGWAEKKLGAGSDQPNLGKLAQHLMSNVLGPMDKQVVKDRQALNDFVEHCGLGLPSASVQP